MATKITRDILEAYLYCKTKAHLKLAGQRGTASAYESYLLDKRREGRQLLLDRVHSRREGQGEDVLRDVILTRSVLEQGAAFILDASAEDALSSFSFDALARCPGPSALGDFHYVPIIYHEGEKPRQEQRTLLAVLGHAIGEAQGRQPDFGIIYFGDRGRRTKVRLTQQLRDRAITVLRGIEDLRRDGKPPRLMLVSHCQVCEFRERCRRQAEEKDDLSLLGGMGEKEIRKLNRKGIFTITQLSCTFRFRKRGKRVKRQNHPHYFALQAAAIRDRKTYVLKAPSPTPRPVRIYFDVEGYADRSFAYLFGLIVDERGSESRHSFWADSLCEEQAAFGEVLRIIGQYDDFTLIHYGSYEASLLRRMKKAFGGDPTFEKVLARAVNLLPIISSHVYFPVHSNGLKSIGKHLGSTWTDPDASGLKSIVVRDAWERTHCPDTKRDLERYNMEDCAALKLAAETVFAICEAMPISQGEQDVAIARCVVARAEDINAVTTRREFGKASFVLDDLEFINGCAYFDYQRERVFLRANRARRTAADKSNRRRRRKPRVDRTIRVTCQKCPRCDSREIARIAGRPHTKLSYDLKLSGTGIRRQVIACTAVVHHCRDCSTTFLPPRYKKRDKHFHGLKSWAIYQHVVHRVSFQRIEAMIEECFGLRVHYEEIHHFKVLMAHYYRSTYGKILAGLVKGDLIHCDETHVNFQTGKGYVWVLANMENSLYVYRPTRDGEWLQDLLLGFKGVLVSDFYTAYDSMSCEQQKCLVHLIRDMNQDLLSSPYDDEFRSLIAEFGALLRGIVSTIDRFGLRHRHLHKHEPEVSRFYRRLEGRSFNSELALGYRKRLEKYRDKLFTFLRHDGIPWNNNNAEHALRPYANYRKTSDGMMTESGLRDYLVLLTISQTCRYRGISFLRFLLSQQRDIDRFQDRGKIVYPKPSLQVYPEGFFSFPRKGKPREQKPLYPNG